MAEVPRTKRSQHGTFQWCSAPPDVTREDVTWVTDGSASHPTCPQISVFGIGVVVVSDDGSLLAYGWGEAPDHIRDSGMAELWAV